MIAEGITIQGHNYIAAPSLGTLGNLIFLFDYRRAADIASGRLRQWSDLGNNGFSFNQPTVSRRFISYVDGLGDDTTTAQVIQMLGGHLSPLNKLKDGSANLFFCVIKLENLNSRINICVTGGSGVAGTIFQILETSGNFRCQINDGSGLIVNRSIAAVPIGEYVLLTKLYYGSGSGSNNHILKVKNLTSTFTDNPVFNTTDNSNGINIGKSTGTGDFKFKLLGSYDLTGKTPAECDTFYTNFINTLKSDLEYSTLITS